MVEISIQRAVRRDFLDPDFGVKASFRLASDRRLANRCKFNTRLASEIPELGLDLGRLNIDCNINPARMADVAIRAANRYSQYRHSRKQRPQKSSSNMSRKKTRLSLETEYDRSQGEPGLDTARQPERDDDEDGDD